MKTLIQRIKRYKLGIVIFLVILLGVLAYNLLKPDDDSGKVSVPILQSPPTQNQLPEEVIHTPSNFKVTDIYHPSGKRETTDSFESIVLTFSDNVDVETLEITVTPQVNLKGFVYEDRPNKLYVQPVRDMWKEKTEYSVTISSSLSSLSGASLDMPIQYVYYNEPPEFVISGEAF